ncbi:hypothetical protein MNBD_NITROSPINAE05-646 [hydrothermal vent metagenome]|uniref:Uncharacterized protein n=1 Tax=hydrothermal vent metagenome TaxID=652676 RepID=A0A3B1DV35_9ZZZZ
MQNEEESKKKLVEFLWVEINRAIIGSKDVKSCIKILKDLDLLDHVEDYNLVLDVQALIDLIQKDEKKGTASTNEEIKEKQRPTDLRQAKSAPEKKTEDTAQSIDGKKLTDNEVLFQKHLERNFDESIWLKKAGIRFLN